MDIRALDKPFLVKLLTRLKMRAFNEESRRDFDNLVRAIDIRKMFCGLFTQDVSEIYYDNDVMIVDLTSYIKPGMESKIERLVRVADQSPKIHEERFSKKERVDRVITKLFMSNVVRGNSLGEALSIALSPDEITAEEQRLKEGANIAQIAPPEPEVSPPPAEERGYDPLESTIEGKIASMEKAAKKKKKKKKKVTKKKKAVEPEVAPEPVPEEVPTEEVAPEPVPEEVPTEEVPPEPVPEEVPTEEVPPEPVPEPASTSALGDLMARLRGIDVGRPEQKKTPAPAPQEGVPEPVEEPAHAEETRTEPETVEETPPAEETAVEERTEPEELVPEPPVEEAPPEEDAPVEASPEEPAPVEHHEAGGETAEAEAGASSLELIMKKLRGSTVVAPEQPKEEEGAEERAREALHDAVADGTISEGDTEIAAPVEDDAGKKKKKKKGGKRSKKKG